VSLVTQAALKEMQYPGILAVGMPVAVGMVFRVVGYFTNRYALF
jgi:H+-translocating diphosphatase